MLSSLFLVFFFFPLLLDKLPGGQHVFSLSERYELSDAG